MMNIPQDPKLQKELAEEHQREILEDVEADKLAEGDLPADEYKSDDYQPVTGKEDELVPNRRENRHIHKD